VIGDQHAVAPASDLAAVRSVAVEKAVHDGGPARVSEQFPLVAEEAACRCMEGEPHAPTARGTHFDQLPFPFGYLLHDHTGVLLVDIDDDFLDRLEPFALLA